MAEIPWQETGAFLEIQCFFRTMDQRRGRAFDLLRDLAGEIYGIMDGLAPDLDGFCRTTCLSCRDNCCARATIWYDFKDLLFLYFSGQGLPGGQIAKKPAGGVCGNLESAGCRLPRPARPFVCTWYLCSPQKALTGSQQVQDQILQVQALRRKMEAAFCRIAIQPCRPG